MFSNVYALEVTQSKNSQTSPYEDSKSLWGNVNWSMIVGIATIVILVGIVLTIIVFIIMWVIRKFSDNRKSTDDYLYYKFLLDYKMSKINANKAYKRKRLLTCFLTYKRSKIYLESSEGKKFLGFYDGEMYKKEGQGYFLVAIMQKVSFFKHETDLVIIPKQLKNKIVRFNLDKTITMFAEGIDEVMSDEYYSIPLIIDPKSDKGAFIDFSDQVHVEYYENYVLRDVIKTNIEKYKDHVEKATELNPKLQLARKSDSLEES